MFTIDTNPDHDRSFAQVAPLLRAWHRLQQMRPSALERAWHYAGFGLEYEVGLTRHLVFCARGAAIVFLPAWAASAHPICRRIILEDVTNSWEREERWDVLDILAVALTAIASHDYLGETHAG